jgi:RimJ/RimL family protein N-acetyltransferase
MMVCELRCLLVSDLAAYKALRDEALRAAPDAFTSDYESSVGREAHMYVSRLGTPDEGQFILGAFNTHTLLGCIALEREERVKKRHCANIVSMMVSPSAQRQGIASQLVAQCIRYARSNTILEQLVLTVTASNTHVVRLYERAGFVPYGLLPRAIQVNNMYYDKLHMRLDLR